MIRAILIRIRFVSAVIDRLDELALKIRAILKCMTGKPASDRHGLGKHISVRMNQGIIARLDGLIPLLSTPWHAVNRSDVLRAVIAAGLDVLEAEHRRRP